MATRKKAAPKAAAKKTTARKTTTKKTAVKKTTARKTAGMKGSGYVCGVCGLAVTVDRTCGCVDTCDIICCGRQMKEK
ncbi:MAG: hypothetical protein M0Z79_09160 [Nitrospiraceae bacterium]|nr:hypothetical protein [Nitrospiraceae bacterium]